MSVKLKRVGFFTELEHGDADGVSLKQSISSSQHPEKQKIINYLRSGICFIFSPGLVTDVLSESEEIISSLRILSDGTWAWPNCLIYYVDEYNVNLPDEFIDFMKNRNWMINSNEIDLNLLEL
jgi:hypothetical protein